MDSSRTDDGRLVYRAGLQIARRLGDVRNEEYQHAFDFLAGCKEVLDVGCGTGTFMQKDPKRIRGIDINPENVEYCQSLGLNAQTGNGLEIPFPENTFDGVFCSHVMQVFRPEQAAQLMRELGRVVKPNGVVVIVTLNWFSRFFKHPENARAYPPEALRVYFAKKHGSSSPMFPGIPEMRQEDIWCRRPALFELHSQTSHNRNRFFGVVNRLQYVIGLRKYWTFNAYAIKLRCLKTQSVSD